MKQQQSRLQTLQKQTSLEVKEFLSNYKVNYCDHHVQRYEHNCYEYHSRQDCRRNPYNGYTLKYYPSSDLCPCQYDACPKFHNIYERQFHPFHYKTKACGNYSCQGGLLCPNLHHNQYNLLLKHQFFRFDLYTFKTQACQINHPSNYEYASCRFYHGQSDRRRHPLHYNYTYVECTLKENCRKNDCEYAHNKIQQLYHPQRYKSKYCSKTLNNKNCEYDSFCSFAHHDREITIELLHQLTDDDEFKCFKFKTVWCPYTEQHERNHCVYAHNFNDFRRDPIQFHYQPIDCQHWSKKTIDSLEYCGCDKRMNCEKSHGWYESKYHPDTMYKHDIELKNALIKKHRKGKESFNKEEEQFGTGAPFFKMEDKNHKLREAERHKDAIKPQGNEQEDKKLDKTLDRPEQLREEKQIKDIKDFKKNQMKNEIKRLDLWLFGYEQNLWRKITQKIPEPMKQKERSLEHFKRKYYEQKNYSKKKISKTEIVYSSSLKHMLSIIGLEQKLTRLRVPQRKLISLEEDQINSIEKLTPIERNKLHNCIYEYVKEKKLDSIQYSKSLKQFFKVQNCATVLEKMKIKKIPQQKILNLTPDSINELSFLGEQQKQKLPIIVENYEDDRAFKQIIMLIEEQTKQST